MSFHQNMSIEEFVTLAEKYADERYGTSITAENSNSFGNTPDSILAEALARKERMNRKSVIDKSNWDLTNADMEAIKSQVHMVGNIKVGTFIIKIKNYKNIQDKITVTLDIHEEKVCKNAITKMPQRVNVIKDIRFNSCSWLTYFHNSIQGGVEIPIKTAAAIVRWCQAISRVGAFV